MPRCCNTQEYSLTTCSKYYSITNRLPKPQSILKTCRHFGIASGRCAPWTIVLYRQVIGKLHHTPQGILSIFCLKIHAHWCTWWRHSIPWRDGRRQALTCELLVRRGTDPDWRFHANLGYCKCFVGSQQGSCNTPMLWWLINVHSTIFALTSCLFVRTSDDTRNQRKNDTNSSQIHLHDVNMEKPTPQQLLGHSRPSKPP